MRDIVLPSEKRDSEMLADEKPPAAIAVTSSLTAATYALAAAMTLVSIGAFVLERVKKDNDKVFLYTRIAAAVALVIGTANALLI